MDSMFERHEDLLKRLCADAPALLPILLDGLIWRSRLSEGGQRRVNYYVKHLLVDAQGGFSKAIDWINETKDPKIICHPVLVLVTDLLFNRVAFRTFLYSKAWYLFTTAVFLTSQSILEHLNEGHNGFTERAAIFACRCFIYVFSLGRFLLFHLQHIFKDYRSKQTFRFFCIKLPNYLQNWQDVSNLFLTIALILMLCTEPIAYCVNHNDGSTDKTYLGLFTAECVQAEGVKFPYSVFSMIAMLLYFASVIDLSVFSTRISAFVLVCSRVLAEVLLFLGALLFCLLAFSSSVSALQQNNEDYAGIQKGIPALVMITLGMYSGDRYEALHNDPFLLVAIMVYVITTVIFLLNLLIAQLSCSYASTYQDMLGFARLNRARIVVESMALVTSQRWDRFTSQLRLEERLEFNEGDVGLSGGIQVTEPANANPTTQDTIRRFGGSTSPAMQWPEEDNQGDDEEDRFDKIENLIQKAMKRLSSAGGKRRKGGQGSGQGSSNNDQSGQDDAEDGPSAGSDAAEE